MPRGLHVCPGLPAVPLLLSPVGPVAKQRRVERSSTAEEPGPEEGAAWPASEAET